MEAFKVTFKSGLTEIFYGETKDEALESVCEGVELDACSDVVEQWTRQREFQREHESLLQSLNVTAILQEVKAKQDAQRRLDSEKVVAASPFSLRS